MKTKRSGNSIIFVAIPLFISLIITTIIPLARGTEIESNLAENGKELLDEGCSKYFLNMFLWFDHLHEDRRNEILQDLENRGLDLSHPHIDRIVRPELILTDFGSTKIIQRQDNIEQLGFAMKLPQIKSILDVVFTKTTNAPALKEIDLIECI